MAPAAIKFARAGTGSAADIGRATAQGPIGLSDGARFGTGADTDRASHCPLRFYSCLMAGFTALRFASRSAAYLFAKGFGATTCIASPGMHVKDVLLPIGSRML